jgi:hypothetical protein
MAQHVCSVVQPLSKSMVATQELQLFAIAGSSSSGPSGRKFGAAGGRWGPIMPQGPKCQHEAGEIVCY